MPTLTFEQVKQAGRYAIRDVAIAERQRGYFEFLDGVPFYVPLNIDRRGQLLEVPMAVPTDGWQHLPGCDCKFCHE